MYVALRKEIEKYTGPGKVNMTQYSISLVTTASPEKEKRSKLYPTEAAALMAIFKNLRQNESPAIFISGEDIKACFGEGNPLGWLICGPSRRDFGSLNPYLVYMGADVSTPDAIGKEFMHAVENDYRAWENV